MFKNSANSSVQLGFYPETLRLQVYHRYCLNCLFHRWLDCSAKIQNFVESPPHLFCIFVKMKSKAHILMLLCSILLAPAMAQVKDSTIRVSMFDFSYSFQIPGGDLSDRYGNNSD